MNPSHLPRLVAFGLLSQGAAACFKVPQESASLSAMEATDITAGELQMRVYETGRRFSWIIESAADTIAKRTSDPEIRRLSLRWKIVMIPLVEEASLRADPVVAAADLWALAMQQSNYLTTGGGREVFGELQPIAIAAADTLEQLAAETAGRLRSDGRFSADEEAALQGWAARHPITGSSLGRESILSSNWEMLSITETSLTGTVASVQRSLTGVTNRLGYLNEGIFKRVLWQSELVARDVVPPLLEQGRAALLSDISAQQDKMFASITEQRTAAMGTLSTERAAVLAAVRMERQTVLDAMSAERAAVLEAVHRERLALFAAVREERKATLAGADSIAQRSIERAASVATRLVLWTFVALLVLVIVAGFGAVHVARAWRSAP